MELSINAGDILICGRLAGTPSAASLGAPTPPTSCENTFHVNVSSPGGLL